MKQVTEFIEVPKSLNELIIDDILTKLLRFSRLWYMIQTQMRYIINKQHSMIKIKINIENTKDNQYLLLIMSTAIIRSNLCFFNADLKFVWNDIVVIKKLTDVFYQSIIYIDNGIYC